MNLTYETIDKEKSQVLLKIKVDKEDVIKEYQNILADLQKNAQIQGFRKGKVPTKVLEVKYKEGILADAANQIIEKAYKEVIEKIEKKPIVYAAPKLENFKLPELDKDFAIEILYDVYPTFTIKADFKEIEVEKDEIKISDEDINEEIERHLKRLATIEPKEGKINENDIVLIDYTANLDGNEFYKKENEQINIGKDYDLFKLSKDLLGMKKGDEKEFEKSFDDKEIEKISGKTFKIKLKINEVKEEKIPELNDELAQQIDEKCTTVKELNDKIKEELDKYALNSAKQIAINNAIKQLVESFNGDLPESMINEQEELFYKDMVNKFGGNEKNVEKFLKMDNLTKESYKEKVKDEAIYDIKKGLIIQKLVKDNSITATEDEIKEKIKPFAERYKMGVEEVLKMYKDAGQLDLFKSEIEMQKAIDFLHDSIRIKKGKKKTLKELFNQNTKNKE